MTIKSTIYGNKILESADLVGPLTPRRVNYIFIDVIYSKFEVIDFSVISNPQKMDWNPCIKNRTMNL